MLLLPSPNTDTRSFSGCSSWEATPSSSKILTGIPAAAQPSWSCTYRLFPICNVAIAVRTRPIPEFSTPTSRVFTHEKSPPTLTPASKLGAVVGALTGVLVLALVIIAICGPKRRRSQSHRSSSVARRKPRPRNDGPKRVLVAHELEPSQHGALAAPMPDMILPDAALHGSPLSTPTLQQRPERFPFSGTGAPVREIELQERNKGESLGLVQGGSVSEQTVEGTRPKERAAKKGKSSAPRATLGEGPSSQQEITNQNMPLIPSNPHESYQELTHRHEDTLQTKEHHISPQEEAADGGEMKETRRQTRKSSRKATEIGRHDSGQQPMTMRAEIERTVTDDQQMSHRAFAEEGTEEMNSTPNPRRSNTGKARAASKTIGSLLSPINEAATLANELMLHPPVPPQPQPVPSIYQPLPQIEYPNTTPMIYVDIPPKAYQRVPPTDQSQALPSTRNEIISQVDIPIVEPLATSAGHQVATLQTLPGPNMMPIPEAESGKFPRRIHIISGVRGRRKSLGSLFHLI
jgi:hypothetical protein